MPRELRAAGLALLRMRARTVGAVVGAAIAAGWTLIALFFGSGAALIVAPAIGVASLLGALLAPGAVATRTPHKAPLTAIGAVTGWGKQPPAPYTRDLPVLTL